MRGGGGIHFEMLEPRVLLNGDATALHIDAGAAHQSYIDQALAPFGPNNLLVANGHTFREYTRDGQLVQQVAIASPNTDTPTARDIEVDASGRVHIMSIAGGTFMSTFDPRDGSWQHNTIAGWDLTGVTYYGGTAVTERYVFAPDRATGPGPESGIIRFDLNDLSIVERFPAALEPHAVTYGLNGLLYIIDRNGNIAAYDPLTVELVRDYPFGAVFNGASVTGVAVDFNGDIYTSDLDNNIHRNDSDGNLIHTLFDTTVVHDINLEPAGTLVGSSTAGAITLTDRQLDAFTTFATPDGPGPFDVNFVSFTRPFFVPVVSRVLIEGGGWTPTFADAVDAADGRDDGAYTVPVGSDAQLDPLPWIDADAISIVFSENVNVTQADLMVAGVNTVDYTPSITGFNYHPATFTATWMFASPFGADKLLIFVSDNITAADDGAALDGEWTDGVSTRSGDGAAGGEFRFRANVLPGDATRNGLVAADDALSIIDKTISIAGAPGYGVFHDLNGNGLIAAEDALAAIGRAISLLPAGDPALPGGLRRGGQTGQQDERLAPAAQDDSMHRAAPVAAPAGHHGAMGPWLAAMAMTGEQAQSASTGAWSSASFWSGVHGREVGARLGGSQLEREEAVGP